MLDRIKYFFLNNKRLLLLIAGILMIILIAVFSIPWGKKEKAPSVTTTAPGAELAEEAVANIQKQELTAEDVATANIFVTAKSFAEIYGSYSNQSNYANMEAVLPLLSSSYRTELEKILNDFRASYKPGEIYEGTTTLVLSSVTEELDETAGSATIVLKTQRKISKGSQANYTVQYQDIRVDLLKEGDGWLVDSAKWLQ